MIESASLFISFLFLHLTLLLRFRIEDKRIRLLLWLGIFPVLLVFLLVAASIGSTISVPKAKKAYILGIIASIVIISFLALISKKLGPINLFRTSMERQSWNIMLSFYNISGIPFFLALFGLLNKSDPTYLWFQRTFQISLLLLIIYSIYLARRSRIALLRTILELLADTFLVVFATVLVILSVFFIYLSTGGFE